MSNKKKRNRKVVLNSLKIEVQGTSPSQITVLEKSGEQNSADQSVFGGVGVIPYLKSHLWLIGIICFVTLGTLGAGLKYLNEDAKSKMAHRTVQKEAMGNEQDQSFLNKVNPFLPTPAPTPTPKLSREYVYASGKLLAIEDANANSAPPADLAIWRPDTGYWWVRKADGSAQAVVGWGQNGDDPVEGDYDGDGKTDFAIYRPATLPPNATQGSWWIMRSSDNSYFSTTFGAVDDVPAQADFDGDGQTDIALFRPSAGDWYIILSSTLQTIQWHFGQNGDLPAPADYDGDGKADPSVWRGSEYAFYSTNSSNNALQTPTFGAANSGDKVVSADYDGDGRADFAMYKSSTADWYIWQSMNGQQIHYQWGVANDIAVQNDYDGDGKVDIAVWHDATGVWTIRNSSNPSQPRTVQWGQHLDIPVPAFYRR